MKAALLSATILVSLSLFSVAIHAAELVNINTASKSELDSLPGIGEEYAQRIIDYREANGPFAKIEDIQNVKGIGPKTFEDMKHLITVGSTAQPQTTNGDDEEETSIDSAEQDTSSSSSSSADVSLKIEGKSVVVAGAEVEFIAKVTKGAVSKTSFKWNFGDGVVGKGERIKHTFAYPGKYAVVLSTSKDEAQVRLTVEVVALELFLVAEAGHTLALVNDSKREVDIGRWSLRNENVSFFIPEGTVILGGETLRFAPEITGIEDASNASLNFPSGNVAAVVGAAKEPAEAAVGIVVSKKALTVSPAAMPQVKSSNKDSSGKSAFPITTYGIYGGGLAALIGIGVAAALFARPRSEEKPETKRPEDEFEIV